MSQPVKLVALLKAKPGMSRAEFERRWVEEHAPLICFCGHIHEDLIPGNCPICRAVAGRFKRVV